MWKVTVAVAASLALVLGAVALRYSDVPEVPLPEIAGIDEECIAAARRAAWLSWAEPRHASQPQDVRPTPVTVDALLKEGHNYDGVVIEVLGYMHVEFESVAIYSSKKAFLENVRPYERPLGVWVDLRPVFGIAYWNKGEHKASDRCVRLVGRFDSLSRGHLGGYGGTIGALRRLEVWHEPHLPFGESR